MTANEIIAMAEQAGYPHVGLKWNDQEQAFLMRFAALVAAREREKCATECESRVTPGTGSVAILGGAADAIRARLDGKQ